MPAPLASATVRITGGYVSTSRLLIRKAAIALVDADGNPAEQTGGKPLLNGNREIALAGASDREEHRVAFMERLAPAYGDDWWFLGAHGFALTEAVVFYGLLGSILAYVLV